MKWIKLWNGMWRTEEEVASGPVAWIARDGQQYLLWLRYDPEARSYASLGEARAAATGVLID